MKKNSLSIVIPIFNEQQAIGYVLQDALTNLPKIVSDFEIIVIDDGSSDNTYQIVKEIVEKNKRIKRSEHCTTRYGRILPQ